MADRCVIEYETGEARSEGGIVARLREYDASLVGRAFGAKRGRKELFANGRVRDFGPVFQRTLGDLGTEERVGFPLNGFVEVIRLSHHGVRELIEFDVGVAWYPMKVDLVIMVRG